MKSIIIKIILILEFIIYITFTYNDLNYKNLYTNTSFIKYIGILLCLLLSFLIGNDGYSKKDSTLLQFALILTALADLCLVILNKTIPGVFFFCLVQITYITRYSGGKLHLKNIYTIVILVILSVFTSKTYIHIIDSRLLFIASIYAILLPYSVYTSYKTLKRKIYPKDNCYLVSIAMTLFLLCDINVGISHTFLNHNGISTLLVWTFYLPSQVLLALSGYDFKKELSH
ncbi:MULTISPECIES: lysoplasmalogenase family protein [Clostridium]|uniref:lysoplasmalogenase family protein n=1 Tax=Clostridium TaxID=1485 RepID=UPI0008267FE7|nr:MULTISPECIES: lysoplasmalogenase family protein [Clostridium]PJI08198.1 hypothetical protein CUB90_10125 [Clostridium sp. CT7]